MAEVIYNPQSNYSQQPSPNQPSGYSDNSSGTPHSKTPLIVILIIIILLSFFTSTYLIFGRSATEPVSQDTIEKSLPAGASQ